MIMTLVNFSLLILPDTGGDGERDVDGFGEEENGDGNPKYKHEMDAAGRYGTKHESKDDDENGDVDREQ